MRLVLSLICVVFFASCNGNSVEPSVDIKLTITQVNWGASWNGTTNSGYVDIASIIMNEAGVPYYAKLGDPIHVSRNPNLKTFLGGAAVFLEKFNFENQEWQVLKSFDSGNEGSNVLRELPVGQSDLSLEFTTTSRDEHDQYRQISSEGIRQRFRIKIDYFDVSDPSDETIPYTKYSNVF